MRAAIVLWWLSSTGCESIFPLELDLEERCGKQGYERVELEAGFGYYRVESVEAKWVEAELACHADGPSSHLAVLGSSNEIAVVHGKARATLQALGMDGDILIGLSKRATDGEYHWVTDEPIPIPSCHTTDACERPPWGGMQPQDPDLNKCAELSFDNAAFVTVPCSEPEPYICECDAFEEAPANF